MNSSELDEEQSKGLQNLAVESFDEALNGIDEEDSNMSSHSSFSSSNSDEKP